MSDAFLSQRAFYRQSRHSAVEQQQEDEEPFGVVYDGDDEESSFLSTSSAAATTIATKEAQQLLQDERLPSRRHQRSKKGTYSARFLSDNGLELVEDAQGRITARPRVENETIRKLNSTIFFRRKDAAPLKKPPILKEQRPQIVPTTGFNVVLTHCTADFDSLASAVGLAKLWSAEEEQDDSSTDNNNNKSFDSASHVPTFVVLPRGSHPAVQRFLALHKHLFPIRSLKSLPSDLSNLNRLALVDAQRRERLGPAEPLLQHAKRVTVVDHHIDQDSDIEATDYVVDQVGSVTTLIVERLQETEIELSEAEATLLALGIHADTGSLCFDSTTPRDASALAWCLVQGASQAAIAEHAQASLSQEQQGVLTQALINTNSTVAHGVTISTVLLSADGFINGLAAVTQDALELSSADVYILALVYEAQSGGRKRSSKKSGDLLKTRLFNATNSDPENSVNTIMFAEAWKGGEEVLRQRRLRTSFDRYDTDGSGTLEENEVAAALASLGVIASKDAVNDLMTAIDQDGNGKISFDEFVLFASTAEKQLEQNKNRAKTMILVGRARAGVHMKSVKLNKLFERFGGGGHPKAASATVRLNDEVEAQSILQSLVDELVEKSLQSQPTVGDFMTSPVLSVRPDMTEKQVEDLFVRYDVRALPVVDENDDVIGLVTYKEVAAAKQRLFNKEQKRLRQEKEAAERGEELPPVDQKVAKERKSGTTVKGWMLQHVQVVEASKTMAEVESILLENDIGCMPVVVDGTKQLVGLVTRTDLLRQHRYYSSLHYHNKGFADSIAARKPMVELRKRLKQFDIE